MNKFNELKELFTDKKITKNEFIEIAGELHNVLYDYSEMLDSTIAKKIEITSENVIIELNSGVKLSCIKDDYRIIPIEILNFGHYEESLWDKLVSLLDKTDVCFDIGGNIGYFSLYMSTKLPNTEFYTFEPIEKTYGYLEKNLELNNTSKIKAFNFGLSSEEQELEMFYNPHLSGNSSLKDLSGETYIQKIICKFSTLDNFVEQNDIKNIDFIKCDVEGAEKFVFEGGLETLKRFKPIIFTEMLRKWSEKFNYHPNDIIELLKPLGYKCYAISEEAFYEIDKVTKDTLETNFVFK